MRFFRVGIVKNGEMCILMKRLDDIDKSTIQKLISGEI